MNKRILLTCIFIFAFCGVKSQESEFNKLWKSYESAMDSGDYNAALKPISELVEMVRSDVGMEDIDYAKILIYKAILYSKMGSYEKAIPLHEQALAIRKKVLGPVDKGVALSLNYLGELYTRMGQYEKALPLIEEGVAIYKKVLGQNHPDVATSLLNLAVLYHHMGQYEEALPLYIKVLVIRVTSLGLEHPAVGESRSSLAGIYSSMGQNEKALPLYEESLAIFKKTLGDDHPDVAASMNNLASTYSDIGQHEKALALFEEALAIRKDILGPEHPDVATSMNNLASIYTKMGEYEKALPLDEEALDIRKKTMGPNHPEVATSLNNLAVDFSYMGQYEKALPLYEEALAIRKMAMGMEHPDVANSMDDLAFLYTKMGEYEKALPLNEEALAIYKRTLGPDHPDVATSLNKFALLYSDMGQYEKALVLFEEALAIHKTKLAPEHPNVATSMNNLAWLYCKMGKYEKALPLYEEALAIRKTKLAPEHPNVATSMNNLAWLYSDMGQYEIALQLNQEALAILKNTLGPDHPAVATSLNHLGNLYFKMGEYKKALQLNEEELAIYKNVLGADHPHVTTSMNNLALLYTKMGQYEKALPLNEETLARLKKVLGPEHTDVANSLNNLAVLYSDIGQYEKALPLHEEALAICKKTLGMEHPDVANSLGSLAFCYFKMGQNERALILLNESNMIFKKQITTDFTILSESQKLNYLNEKSNRMLAYDSYVYLNPNHLSAIKQTAMNNSIFLDGLVLRSSQQLRYNILHSNDSTLKISFNDWLNVKRHYSSAMSLTVEERAHKEIDINKLEEEISRRERELSMISAAFSIEKEKENLDFLKLKSKLKEGQAYVLFNSFPYFNDKDWTDSVLYTAYVIRPEISEPGWVYLFEQKSLDSLLSGKDVTASIPTLYGNSNLYNLLLKPLSPFLEGVKEIYYTPSGSLHKLSFSAISDSSGNLLSDKYTLHQITSASQLVFPANVVLLDTVVSGSTSIALFGGINYQADEKELAPVVSSFIGDTAFAYSTRSLVPAEADRGMNWHSLPGTQKEVTEIQRLFEKNQSNSILFSKNNALEEQVKMLEGEKAPKILHFATHGFFLPDPKIDINKYYSRHNLLSIASPPFEPSQFGGIGCSFNIINDTLLITGCLPEGPCFKAGILPGDIIIALNGENIAGVGLTNELAKNKLRGPVGSNFEIVVFRKPESKVIKFKIKRELIQNPSNYLTTNSSLTEKSIVSNLKSSPNPLLRSGLLFSGSAHTWKGEPTLPGAEDGILTAMEVANLNLINTKLVVLSACETALGDIKGKEGVFGLQRGFKLAGVDYIIMSLWRIPDLETSEFMIKFYTYLLKENNIPKAFAQAQSEMKSKYRDEPYKWAGLVLVE